MCIPLYTPVLLYNIVFMGYSFHGSVFLMIGDGLDNALRITLIFYYMCPTEIVVYMFILFLIPPSLKMLPQDDNKCQRIKYKYRTYT